MKILFIIHAEFEKPGSIESWAKKNGHQTKEVHIYKGDKLAHDAEFDLLVSMGGPQSPLELHNAPYLADEIEFIKKAIENKKRILGFCLGAQLIAEALGAKTEKSPNKEIGAYPLELLPDAKYDPVFQNFPQKFEVMHWHSDMPGIPEGAKLLAKSEGCPRQAFSYGDRIYGFQCHFEITKELAEGMIKHCPSDLNPGTYIMTEKELMAVNYDQINSMLEKVLNYLAEVPEIVLPLTSQNISSNRPSFGNL